MGGIAGIVDPEQPSEALRAPLAEMLRALSPAGAPPADVWCEGPLALGQLGAGPAPLESPDGRLVLLFDGQLANAEELGHAYAREYPFTSQHPAEIALAALALDGLQVLERFSGAFAFFLWDRRARRGVAVRDRAGVKPLFFSRERARIAFASAPRALLAASGARAKLDVDAVVEWVLAPALSGYVRTPFEGIEVLPPGHLLHVEPSGLRVERWRALRPGSRAIPEDVLLDEVPRRVYVATSMAASGDAPTGVLLSGGFSSTLVAGIADFMRDELTAFTARVGDADDRDAALATGAAEKLELEHQQVELASVGFAEELARIAAINEALPTDESELALSGLLRAAATQVKVLLVGDGADALHFGDPLLLDASATRSPEGLLAALGAPAREALLHPELRARKPVEQLSEIYREQVEGLGQVWTEAEGVRAAAALLASRKLARRLQDGELHAAAAGLERRVPFASSELTGLAERVAPEIALKGGLGKWHLRQGMEDELPEEIRWRPPHAPRPGSWAVALYRAELARLLQEPGVLARIFDVSALGMLARGTGPVSEAERTTLFLAVVLAHWARHHRVE